MSQRPRCVIALGLLLAAAAVPEAHGQTPPAHHGTLPAVSPGGRHVAFISTRDGQTDLYVIDAEGRDTTRLTSTAAEESRPVWSADGREILVSRIWGAAVSPAGDRIAFGRRNGDTLQVFTMSATGEDLRPVGPFEGRAQMPAWAPDGRRLAVQVNTRPGGTSQARIWVIDLTSGSRQELASGTPPHLDEVPSWFPDGRRVAFQSDRSGPLEVWTIDVESGELRQLTK